MVGVTGIGSAGAATPRSAGTAEALLAANTSGKAVNVEGLAKDLAALPARDADAATAAVQTSLSPVQRGELDRALAAISPPGEASATVGANEVQWTLDANGHPKTATATLSELQPEGTERSSAETSAQDRVRERGKDDDDAGHVIGHRFLGDQGERNMFPQNFNFNRSAYKTLENEWASWIEAGATVKINVTLKGGTSDRPDQVGVTYEAFNVAGKRVYKNAELFDNAAGQTFDRISAADIRAMLGQ